VISGSTQPVMRARITLLLLAPVMAAGLAVGGCGGSSAGTAAKPTAGASPSGRAAFTQCLRSHGVTLPSGRPTPGSGQFPAGGLPTGGAASKAFQACRNLAPAGFSGGGTGGTSAFTAFTSCLSSHGVTLKGTGIAALSSLNQHSSKVKKALKICKALLPQGLPISGG
jgi:hypothetical protein